MRLSLARAGGGRGVRLFVPALAALWLGAPAAAGEARADPPEVGIELNKAESTGEGCRTLFVFDNRSGHELDRFKVELVLFDQKGVYARRVMLDMAPLYEDKKTVAAFMVSENACDGIGSILINDIPQCENGLGNAIDCIELLKVSSKSSIPLEK